MGGEFTLVHTLLVGYGQELRVVVPAKLSSARTAPVSLSYSAVAIRAQAAGSNRS
jgi:hypothetical protein